MIHKTDLAYMAGIVDGEGCIDIYKHKAAKRSVREYRYTMRLTVGMGRPELPKRLLSLFGGTVHISKPVNSNRSAEWRWSVSSRKAMRVLKEVLPFLFLKKDQAKIAIELQTLQSGWRKEFGGIATPQSVIDKEDELWIELKSKRGRKYREAQM